MNLLDICEKSLLDKGLIDQKHIDRLKIELKEIDNQSEYDYFLDLYLEKKKFSKNENNLLIPYLLDLVDHFDIDSDPVYVYGDFPDVDVDYIDVVADYIKNTWAPNHFGSEYVCNIANYGTMGVKQSLIDCARVLGHDRGEIIAITTKIGLKDDDGEDLTWDTALIQNKELALYCQKYPDVADAASRLVGRCRNRSKHAGGLIISKNPISDVVPLCVDTDGNPISSWSEGQRSQDLGIVGYIKFDALGLTNLKQIGYAINLIKQRYNLSSICAFPGGYDWSDDAYLNDPKALELANKADLKGVFQFGSDGIRKLVKDGGVNCFDDLAAYTAIWRPGCLTMKMHDRYVLRKKGLEKYSIHPLLQDVLGKTYGVIVYQEQIHQILNKVGKIPLKDCEMIRKAISKKKDAIFAKYKQMFIENGQKTLNWAKELVMGLWDQIDAFAGYGFNKAHAYAYSIVSARLLWLKAHYPLELFTAILYCEDKDKKLKEYKLSAEKLGVKVNKVNLNISKELASIHNGEIYLGFSNVKGIGFDVSAKIVANQPYNSIEDFLQKFGTDTSVLKPLIGLGLFDGDRAKLLEYSEHYKKEIKKKKPKLVALNDFEPKGTVKDDLVQLYQREIPYAEQKYYGFSWNHIMEKYTDYDPEKTFNQFTEDEDLTYAPVQVQIINKPQEKKSKKGTLYYLVEVEDSNSEVQMITFWQDDFDRFREELSVWDEIGKGNIVSMVVQKPTNGFKNYNFYSPPKHLKVKMISEEKIFDYRLKVMVKDNG